MGNNRYKTRRISPSPLLVNYPSTLKLLWCIGRQHYGGGDAVTFEIDRGACLQVIDRKEVILGEVQTCGGSYYLPRVKSSISACIPLCVHHSIFPFSVSRNPLTLSPSTRYADRSFPGNVADIFERFFDNKNPPEKSVWRKMIYFQI